jgi:tellurite resistance protein
MLASLRFLPAAMFGAVMGLAGLGLAWRTAALALPIPAWPAEAWVLLAAIAFCVLAASYALKALRHPQAVGEELSNPATIGFCAALPVGMTLLAGGLQPHLPGVARAVWWGGVLLVFALQARMLWVLARGGTKLAQVNGGWMIVFVGGIVVPSSGLPLGEVQLSSWMFTFSACAAVLVMTLVMYRVAFGPPMPDAAKPGWFILLVPPSLIYLNGLAVWNGAGERWLEVLYLCGLTLAAVLFIAARGLARWPFGAPWWAFTFPLDALAAASAHFAQDHPHPYWRWMAGVLLAVAALFAAWVLFRTLAALARGTLLKPPA